MTSRLESLPRELYDMIIDHLDLDALSRLVQCNSLHRDRVESRLYATSDARKRAMRWGCEKNSPEAIQRSIKFGANASYLYPERRHETSGRCTPTAFLAAMSCSTEALRYLIVFGVEMNYSQLGYVTAVELAAKLRREKYWNVLRLLVESGLVKTFPILSAHILTPVLISKICHDGPKISSESIDWLLEHGADINGIISLRFLGSPRRRYASPLTGAIYLDSEAVFDQLLRRSAKINGPALHYKEDGFGFIPIFAACDVAEKQGLKWVKRCIEAGADVNAGIYLRLKLPNDQLGQCHYLQVLAAYLIMDHNWDSDKDYTEQDVVTYLLNRGARWVPSQPPLEWPSSAMYHDLFEPCLVEILVGKLTPALLDVPVVFAALKDLIHLGIADDYIERILQCDHRPELWQPTWRVCYGPQENSRIQTAWKRFLDLLLDRHLTLGLDRERSAGSLHCLLSSVVLHLGKQMPKTDHHITFVTIEHLVARGGSINTSLTEGPVLHQLCSFYNNEIKNQLSFRVSETDKDWGKRHEDLFRFLLDIGADPDIVVSGSQLDRLESIGDGCKKPESSGKTARDLLMRDLPEYMTVTSTNFTDAQVQERWALGKAHLHRLADICATANKC